MSISPKGHLAVSCHNSKGVKSRRKQASGINNADGGGYRPPIFPGRVLGASVHVWDKHGKLVYEDAIPGIVQIDGVGIDAHDDLTVMLAQCRMMKGKPHPIAATETLMKFSPKKGKILGSHGAVIPLQESAPPVEEQPVRGSWVEGAHWMYGGVGLGGKTQLGCCCWFSRFTLDTLGRSFAPSPDLCSVAVVDTAGNLILRVGRYGNVDDGKPLITEGGPPAPRSIGGDEVGLVYPCYVAAHTDRRLFIADVGNACIRSVKLGYHADEKVPLKDVPDKAGPQEKGKEGSRHGEIEL
jgi:hypothetical protein